MKKCPKENLPETFFKTVHEVFQQAVHASDNPVTQDYLIGGALVRLRFANSTLVSLVTPALAHLAASIPSQEPSLTICLGDNASTGACLPFPRLLSDAPVARHPMYAYNDDRFCAAFDRGSGSLKLLDTQRKLALYWVRDGRLLPDYEQGAPLLPIFHWGLAPQGCQALHAAAVGTPEGGLLLAGRGGSGKSTTALTCLDAGLSYAGDDFCLLSTQPESHAWSLYNSGKLSEESLTRLSHFSAYVHNKERPTNEKALFFLHRYFPERIATSFPLRAVLLPHVTGRVETTVRQASAAEGLKALAPSTIFQLPGAGQSALRAMAALMRQVPCYRLELGTKIQDIPDIISRLLAGEQPPGSSRA